MEKVNAFANWMANMGNIYYSDEEAMSRAYEKIEQNNQLWHRYYTTQLKLPMEL